MKLVATKSLSYNTRRLQPGDQFEASDKDAKLLVGIKKAVAAIDRKPGKIASPSAKLKAKAAAAISEPVKQEAPAPDVSSGTEAPQSSTPSDADTGSAA